MKRKIIICLALSALGCSGGPAVTAPATPAGPAPDPKALFISSCSACHGPDAQGVKGLGKPLVGSAMFQKTDAELLEFVKKGRDASDKANTTGVAMPPRGGNPGLSDVQIGIILTYLRSLQK